MLLRLFAIVGPAYMLSQFLRNAVAVLAPEMAQELGIGSQELGALAGAFFIAFAAAQLPLGIAFDRFGPRRVMAAMMVVNALAVLAFALAETAAGLMWARALMGIGCAPLFMGPLVIFARGFEQERFAGLTAMQLAIGNLGVLLATTPLALAAEHFGWRGTLVLVAALAAGLALLLWRAVPERIGPNMLAAPRRESLAAGIAGVITLARDRRLWRILPLLFTGYGTIASIVALWGGPYLADVYGLDPVARGNILFLMAAGLVVGPLLYGPLDRRLNTRKWIVLPGAAMPVAALLALAIIGRPPLWALPVLLVLVSINNGAFTIAVAHARALYPEHAIGRGMTLANMAVMGGVGVLQPLGGTIAHWIAGGAAAGLPVASYRGVFGFLGLVLSLALAIYATAADCPPRARAHGAHQAKE
ncbi:MAG: MFS transporter [Alphaproteobacteria bacterium]|nr:MAG: MFS transporter [Alphaproteobacteria bacterium]